MLSTVGRRACASTPRILRTLGGDGGSAAAAAVDQLSGGLGLGFSSCFSGAVVQGGNGVLLQGSPGGGAGAAGFLQLNQVRGFIQLRTNLEVADNSGARRVQCIKVMKGSNAAQIGDTIMASVKDAQPRGKVKKGEVVTCVVVRAATHKMRRDGSEIRFDKNAVVLVNKQGEPIGTRIFGPVPDELRRRKLVKILTLAEHVA